MRLSRTVKLTIASIPRLFERLPIRALREVFSYGRKTYSQYCAGFLEQSMGARKRVGTVLPYRPVILIAWGPERQPIPSRLLVPTKFQH